MEKEIESRDIQINRSILKAISVFGSMRFFQLISGIISSKFIALFIGPAGLGNLGLIKSTISLIQSFTSFGYSIVVVKEIAANRKDKTGKFLEVVGLSKKLSNYIGFIGFIITFLLSVFLSKWIFHTYDKFYWFALLSFNFLFLSKNAFFSAYMQANLMMKTIALSGALASVITTLFIIPVYYILKEEGIIPAILIANTVVLCLNIYFLRKELFPNDQSDFKSFYIKSKPMLAMGVVLSLNLIVTHFCNFGLRSFFKSAVEDTSILGFYEVSITIITVYAGTVFNVMSVDFYPRLSACNKNNTEVKDLVNKQILISLIIVLPLILCFYLFDILVIKLMYTEGFLPVIQVFKFGLIVAVIKSISWPISYIILAKGNKRQYLKQEVIGNLLNVALIIFLFLKFGLIGIGLGMSLEHALYGVYIYFYVKKEYSFSLYKSTIRTILLSGVIVCFTVIAYTLIADFIYQKIIITIFFITSLVYSIVVLNANIGLLNLLKRNFFKR